MLASETLNKPVAVTFWRKSIALYSLTQYRRFMGAGAANVLP